MANNVTALQLSGSKKSKESDREHTSEEKKKKQPESKGFRIPKKVCLQCSTLIFLLTCPLGNYVTSFTCRVYFLVAQEKSPARFARSFIEFSILVPSYFNAYHKSQARGHTIPLPANHKKFQLYLSCLNDVCNTYDRLFVGGFLKTLIDKLYQSSSQGKSLSHDVWYFRSCLLFPAKTSG